MDVKVDFKDVDTFFQKGLIELQDKLRFVSNNVMSEANVGGTYKNHTYRLRHRMAYKINRGRGTGRVVPPLITSTINTNAYDPQASVYYASIVEGKGYDVLSFAFDKADTFVKKHIECEGEPEFRNMKKKTLNRRPKVKT
jgi:hypothetical protein